MQNRTEKDSDQRSCVVSFPLWWNSIGSQISQSSKSLSLKMDSPPHHCCNAKQLDQLHDQGSSSTQSTSQSHHEVATTRGSHPHGQCISTQFGVVQTYGKRSEGHIKSVGSLGNPDFAFPYQVDYGQSMARIPYPYADPYGSGLSAAYGAQTIIHPQMMGMTPARVPLPLDLAEDEPIYVNAKQYRGILRRRQSRAKLEAQNKLVKDRKPYLHESRHLHALKRARGTGGRFLNTKKLQQSKVSATTNSQEALDSAHPQQGGNRSESEVLQSETGNGVVSATTYSDVTSVSNGDDIFQQHDTRFSVYSHHMGQTRQDGAGIMCNGSQHRVPVMR